MWGMIYIRKQVLDEIGLLDENFFAWGAEPDYSRRLILNGWKISKVFIDTKIVHTNETLIEIFGKEKCKKLLEEAKIYESAKQR